MKNRLLVLLFVGICICVFSGCTHSSPITSKEEPVIEQEEPIIEEDEYKHVEQIGQVPVEFQRIIENDVFCGVTAFGGRLLKSEICSWDQDSGTIVQQVRMMDIYGNEISQYTCTSDRAYRMSTFTATSDGGFLFVLGFSDYTYGEDAWASDNGFASRVIKMDKEGNLQFNTPLDGIEGAALSFCFEKNGCFYFFGTIQAPETKTRGEYSQTDIYMAILDEDGSVKKVQYIAGSDFDNLIVAEMYADGFILSIRAQSDDGDFIGSESNGYGIDWIFTVNDELEITEKKKETGRGFFDYMIGERDGCPVYRSDALFNHFDAGAVYALIDYGDSYLIVSENITGEYEDKPPGISMPWYYTETVYSLYHDQGHLIFRAAVDSSPDYD